MKSLTSELLNSETKTVSESRPESQKSNGYLQERRKNDKSKIPNGAKFGSLTVLNFEGVRIRPSGKGNRERHYACLCDCGVTKVISSYGLRSGKITCCGCDRIGSPAQASRNALYARYAGNSSRRNLAFELSREQFYSLLLGDCHYCGAAPRSYNRYLGEGKKKEEGISDKTKSQAWIPASGVDRKDNSVGYLMYNCVSCCTNCNFMKRSMGCVEFLSHIDAISAHQSKQRKAAA